MSAALWAPLFNITVFAAKNLKRGVELSQDATREVEATFDAVRANLRSAASVFMTGDARAARLLTQQKAEFRCRETDAIRTHFAELRDQSRPAAKQTPPLDLLRGHCHIWQQEAPSPRLVDLLIH